MRGNKRKVTVKLIEEEYINNTRLVEYLARKKRVFYNGFYLQFTLPPLAFFSAQG